MYFAEVLHHCAAWAYPALSPEGIRVIVAFVAMEDGKAGHAAR
jgi:hypothetical protein